MSGIYGLVRFDGGGVDAADAAAMAAAMAPFGPDGTCRHLAGPALLGQMQRLSAPEDGIDLQPRRAGDWLLVAAARLDNRGELLAEFGHPPWDRRPDRALVQEALARWGEGAPARLLGDWQFAAWDGRRRVMLLARDPWGSTGLYFHLGPDRFAFASTFQALLALPGTPRRPDLLHFGQVLTCLADGLRTPYAGLEALPQAHALRVREGTVRRWRYWHPQDCQPLPVADPEAHREAFLQVFDQAVRSSLRTRLAVGAALSGGLDSGAVVALAAPHLLAAGKPLTAFTSVPVFDSPLYGAADEWEAAAATARRAGPNVFHRALPCAKASMLGSLRRHLALTGGPAYAVGNFFWMLELLDRAGDLGIGLLLTGQAGNSTLSWEGTGLWLAPFLRGDLAGAARALAADRTPWRTLRRQFLRPARQALNLGLRWLAGTPHLPPWNRTPIAPAFAAELVRREGLGRALHHPVLGPELALEPRRVFFTPPWGLAGADWHEVGERTGVIVVDPTADLRLVEFCLRTPDPLFRHRGEQRLLVRRAMAGRLPPEVLDPPLRGVQAADLGHRVARERQEFQEVLDRLAGSELARHCLDLARMRAVLQVLERTVDEETTLACVNVLLRGTCVGLALLESG